MGWIKSPHLRFIMFQHLCPLWGRPQWSLKESHCFLENVRTYYSSWSSACGSTGDATQTKIYARQLSHTLFTSAGTFHASFGGRARNLGEPSLSCLLSSQEARLLARLKQVSAWHAKKKKSYVSLQFPFALRVICGLFVSLGSPCAFYWWLFGNITTQLRLSLAGPCPASPKFIRNIAVVVRAADNLSTQTVYLTVWDHARGNSNR